MATWQPAAIMPPDAELVICQAMKDALAAYGETATVYRSIPSPRPARFVAMTSDGGPTDDVRTTARMRVNVFAPTAQDAQDLARLVVALAPTLVGFGGVLRCAVLSGPYEVAEESSSARRYALIEFLLRGEQIA